MAYLDGQTVDLTTAYAPAGVTFMACGGWTTSGGSSCPTLTRGLGIEIVPLDARYRATPTSTAS